MNGYIIRNQNSSYYIGIDSYNNQDWIEWVHDWNNQNPNETILINAELECYIKGEVSNSIVQRFYEWLKLKNGCQQSQLLFFQSIDESILISDGYNLLGYDVAFMEDPEYFTRDYFYSSILHELLNSRILNFHDCMRSSRNELNQNGLFDSPDRAAVYLECRNELFSKDVNNLFEAAYGITYDIVRVMGR